MLKVAGGASILLIVAYALYVTTDTITMFAASMAAFTMLAMKTCLGTGVFAVGVVSVWWLRRQSNDHNRQRDGAFPLREYHLEPWTKRAVNTLAGRPSPKMLLDVNAMMTHGAMIYQGIHLAEPAAGWDRQLAYMVEVERTRKMEALAPGDAVLGNPLVSLPRGMNGVANAATGRLAAGAYDKQPRTIDVRPTQPQALLPAPAPVTVSLPDAMRQVPPDVFPLGYADDGKIAAFNPRTHAHAAIVGSPGTGKTTSVGYLMAAHALRQGWHVVILDADNGVAWSPFAAQAEQMETDEGMIGDQLAALDTEYERRMTLLRNAGAQDIDGTRGVRRMLVVVEEYGDLINTLRIRSRTSAEAVDNQLDKLLRRGRKAGMHFALIDQYPENWSNQLVAGTKARYVFQLGPNQGAKVQEYKANELPDRGVFLHQAQRFTAWHTQPRLQKLLMDVPALDVRERVVDKARSTVPVVPVTVEGVYSPVVERQNEAQNVPFGTATGTPQADVPGRWDSVVATWFAANPQALTGPAKGISDLARAMCLDNEGSIENYLAYKGRAFDLFHDFRNAVRLPGGDRLGVDITNGGA